MALAGVGMTFGNWIGGKLGDLLSPTKASLYLMVSMMGILILNSLMATNIIFMYVLTFLTGANALALVVPLQILLIRNAKESPFLGSSLGQAAFNMGNSIGAFLGGVPLTLGYGAISPWWVGVLLALFGCLILLKIKKDDGRGVEANFILN